ncbi:MAG: GNAT family N-acetyltransferase [Lachnospiraceae bacterium]|nr:GNAT family N-acetyltransferase [Lachnospiraceae bacterium]
MEITRITEKNEAAFEHVLNDTSQKAYPNMVRIGAVDDDKNGVAALSALIDADFIEITSLYVQPKYRKQGYGKALIDTLCEMAKGDYTAITAYVLNDDETEEFLEEMGFDLFDSTEFYYVRLGALLRAEKCRRALLDNDTDEIKNISELDAKEQKIFSLFLSENDMPVQGGYNPEWSTVRFDGNEVADLVLAECMQNDVMIIWQSFDRKNPKRIADHMTKLISLIEFQDNMGNDTRISFTAYNEKFLEVLSILTGNPAHVSFGGRFRKGIKLL